MFCLFRAGSGADLATHLATVSGLALVPDLRRHSACGAVCWSSTRARETCSAEAEARPHGIHCWHGPAPASKTADAVTTRRVLDLPGGYENNPTFGRHPSPLKHAGINLGFFAAESGVFYLTERNRHAWVVGRAAPSSATQFLSTRAWPPVIRASIRSVRKFRNACPWLPICEERGAPLFSQRTRP